MNENDTLMTPAEFLADLQDDPDSYAADLRESLCDLFPPLSRESCHLLAVDLIGRVTARLEQLRPAAREDTL